MKSFSKQDSTGASPKLPVRVPVAKREILAFDPVDNTDT